MSRKPSDLTVDELAVAGKAAAKEAIAGLLDLGEPLYEVRAKIVGSDMSTAKAHPVPVRKVS